VYSIQNYVIVCQWFSPGTPVSPTNKTDIHNITDILLKPKLTTITLMHPRYLITAKRNNQSIRHRHKFRLFCKFIFFQQYISYIVADSFIGGGNRSTWRKPLTNYHVILYRVHLATAGFELTMLVVIGTYCTGSCKSNYHTITTNYSPQKN
jgi:hypothetical protein